MGVLDNQNVYNLMGRLNGNRISIDSEMSETSTNAVQNAVITQAFNDLSKKLGAQYFCVNLYNATLTEEVGAIQINEYNGEPFNCIEYIMLLEIPATSVATEIQVAAQRTTGNWQIINVRNPNFYTTTNTALKTLVFVSYKQNSDIYWESRSGATITDAGAGGASWSDSYAAVPCFPMARPATLFDANGISNIRLLGLFSAGTTIQVWGRISQ